MYRPYVGGKTVNREHLSTILDIDVEHTLPRLSALWWIAAAALLGLAAALWFGLNPLPS